MSACVLACRDEAASTFGRSSHSEGVCDETTATCGCGDGYYDKNIVGDSACVAKAYIDVPEMVILLILAVHLVDVVYILGRHVLHRGGVKALLQETKTGVAQTRLIGAMLCVLYTTTDLLICTGRFYSGTGVLDDAMAWCFFGASRWFCMGTGWLVLRLWLAALPRSLLSRTPNVLRLQNWVESRFWVLLAAMAFAGTSSCVALIVLPGYFTFWTGLALWMPFISALCGAIVVATTCLLGMLKTMPELGPDMRKIKTQCQYVLGAVSSLWVGGSFTIFFTLVDPMSTWMRQRPSVVMVPFRMSGVGWEFIVFYFVFKGVLTRRDSGAAPRPSSINIGGRSKIAASIGGRMGSSKVLPVHWSPG